MCQPSITYRVIEIQLYVPASSKCGTCVLGFRAQVVLRRRETLKLTARYFSLNLDIGFPHKTHELKCNERFSVEPLMAAVPVY